MPSVNDKKLLPVIAKLEQIQVDLSEIILTLSSSPTSALNHQKQADLKSVKKDKIDFAIPLRAFVKKYSPQMNGGKKFALLLAYIAKGDIQKTVGLVEIEREWNRVTAKGLLGMKFNRAYTSVAKENDWVDSDASGYHLRPDWKSIFE